MKRRQFLASAAASALLPRLLRGQNTPGGVDWLSRVQQPPAEIPADAPKLAPLLVTESGESITTRAGWEARRATLRDWWWKFLNPFTPPTTTAPAWKVLEEDRIDNIRRMRVAYDIEPGVATEAYLLIPEGISATDRRPGVVVLHSTVEHSILQPVGLGPDPHKGFGLQLARRGMVTISPRNFLWPTNRGIKAKQETERFHRQHPESRGMARMLHDAQLALNILTTLPEVDPSRLGSVGHSLGAKEVIYLAALDERVKATISSEGGIGLHFSNWEADWYLGSEIKQPGFVHEHHELLALTAPRAFLLIGGDSADGDRSWPFIEAALPVYRLYEGQPKFGLLNHKQGHAVPPEVERAIPEWLAAYL